MLFILSFFFFHADAWSWYILQAWPSFWCSGCCQRGFDKPSWTRSICMPLIFSSSFLMYSNGCWFLIVYDQWFFLWYWYRNIFVHLCGLSFLNVHIFHQYIGSTETDQRADEVSGLGILDLWTPDNHYRWSTSRYGGHVSAMVEQVVPSRLFLSSTFHFMSPFSFIYRCSYQSICIVT